MKSSYKILAVFLGIVLLGMGWFGHELYTYRQGDAYTGLTRIIREDSSKYSFTNPLLFIDNSAATFSILDPLRNKIQQSISESISKKQTKDVSVYFRDLNTTRWTGMNEDELFDPASMLKVILLMAYLRAAEDDPKILSKRLTYTSQADDERFFNGSKALKSDQSYSIQELLADMIIKSGNDSTIVLFNNINKNDLTRIYTDLDFPYPEEDKPELMSAKMYSRLFRVLYSSTYLDRNLSEQVLNLLSQTEFRAGLKAGVPEEIVVAHKFGERTLTLPNGLEERQLHDCGIVYYPNRPYFLCVMTKGDNFENLQKVIADISKITYEYWKTNN
jgi:beta-lactamase class A